MKNPLISIIIPIYKVEKYLRQCIESVVSQTYTNLEIILVDDGSPDGCPAICDEYAQKDDRIIVIHKENGGLSDARNKGIEMATGEYIAFVDSDDWINIDSFDGIVKAIVDSDYPDIVETTLTFYFNDNKSEQQDIFISEYIRKNGFEYDSAIKWISGLSDYIWPAQKKIIKTELIKNNNLKFPLGMLHEDVFWTPTVCEFAKSFAAYEKSWYNYRAEREDSITNSLKLKNLKDLIQITDYIFKNCAKTNNDFYSAFLNRAVRDVYFHIGRLVKDKNNICEIEELLKKYNHLFYPKYAGKFKHKIFSAALLILGKKTALTLLSVLNF